MSNIKHFQSIPIYDENFTDSLPNPIDKNSNNTQGCDVSQSSGFRDFLLRPEILRVIADSGFEHPSEVQQKCIPQAIMGNDIICQAISGMGKTAVYVIAVLQHLINSATSKSQQSIDTLVLCHTRELAYQICSEFKRFSKYIDDLSIMVVFGGVPESHHVRMLKENIPLIVIGTPGRIRTLIESGSLKVDKLKRLIMDECDCLLDVLPLRRDFQTILKLLPKEKQVLMFSATINELTREVCRKITRNPLEIYVDDQSKLTLHGLRQFYQIISETNKIKFVTNLIDRLDFNQMAIFVKSPQRARALKKLLCDLGFPTIYISGKMKQEERIQLFCKFRERKNNLRILVTTDLFGRGVDIERINLIINYDMSYDSNTYLHRVGRAGRFGTKGMAISFISNKKEKNILLQVQSRFEIKMQKLPEKFFSSKMGSDQSNVLISI